MKNQKGFRLTKPYRLLFGELRKDIYCTWSVYDYFVRTRAEKKYVAKKEKKNVILRIDVDFGFHLCVKLASLLKGAHINASFFFLTFPSRYYNLWKSDIPRLVSDMGFEVGLHTDHYYEQLVSGKDAIEGIKKDVERLSKLVGKPIYGMVYHGHKEINALGKTNWDVYKHLKSKDLGLVYHDGYDSPYTKSESEGWRPNTDHPVLSDWLSVVGAWKYCPYYPIKILGQVKTGESIHIVIHPHNAFKYWKNWDYSYGEKIPKKESLIELLINFSRVRCSLAIRYLQAHNVLWKMKNGQKV